MRNLKGQGGITLVALVVTIIVLLILAGVTILYVMSDNGIFGKAQTARTDTNESVVKEVLTTAIIEAQAEHYDPATAANVADEAAAKTFVEKKMTAAGMTATLTFTEFCDTTAGTVVEGTVEYNDVTYDVAVNSKAGTFTVEPQQAGE